MKRLTLTLTLFVALLFGAVTTATSQYWGDQPYDEQQWWNPADWGSRDFGYNWTDSTWYADEDRSVSGPDKSGYRRGVDREISPRYGSDREVGLDSGLFNDQWGFGWNDEFDYGD